MNSSANDINPDQTFAPAVPDDAFSNNILCCQNQIANHRGTPAEYY